MKSIISGINRASGGSKLYLPAEIYNLVYNYTEDKHVTSAVTRSQRAIYRAQTIVEIDTKYTKNFARVCAGCGDVELFADDLTWNEKIELGGYAYDHQVNNGYDDDVITIGGYMINEIDINNLPVPINYLKEMCCKYLTDVDMKDDPFVPKHDPEDPRSVCKCDYWIYLYGFNDKHADELTSRLYKRERWLASNIAKKMTFGKSRAEFILMFNALVVNLKHGMGVTKEKIDATRDKLRGYGIGYTWHDFN
jgi:hypothetical protein